MILDEGNEKQRKQSHHAFFSFSGPIMLFVTFSFNPSCNSAPFSILIHRVSSVCEQSKKSHRQSRMFLNANVAKTDPRTVATTQLFSCLSCNMSPNITDKDLFAHTLP